jgi:hypothetical protein
MRKTINDALYYLRPSSLWSINSLGNISWDPSNDDACPSNEELEQALITLSASEPFVKLRSERNRLLSECDWIVIKAVSSGQQIPNEWIQYMQELRDLPSHVVPQLDELGNLLLSSVQWPKKPII